jgi:hypothetical protein
MKLSQEQKQKILDQFKITPDLNVITQIVFDDEALDGRSKEGRAIRSFLAEQGRQYNTTKSEKKKFVNFTDQQLQFMMGDRINSSMTAFEIAKLVLSDDSIKPLSAEHRAVQEFLYKNRNDIVDETELSVDAKWHSPKSMLSAIRRINKWTGENISEDPKQITMKTKKCIESLLKYYRSYKLDSEINSYKTQGDRELFESEFVRSVWSKDDLTTDELNLYMMVCSNYVRKAKIQKRLDQFNNMLESEELSAEDLTMRLTEHLKATSDELDKCEKRIDSLINKLNGDRAKRLEKKGDATINFLSIVEVFQSYEDRKKMVMMAEMQNRLIAEEIDRLESVDELKGRVFGISRYEIL